MEKLKEYEGLLEEILEKIEEKEEERVVRRQGRIGFGPKQLIDIAREIMPKNKKEAYDILVAVKHRSTNNKELLQEIESEMYNISMQAKNVGYLDLARQAIEQAITIRQSYLK